MADDTSDGVTRAEAAIERWGGRDSERVEQGTCVRNERKGGKAELTTVFEMGGEKRRRNGRSSLFHCHVQFPKPPSDPPTSFISASELLLLSKNPFPLPPSPPWESNAGEGVLLSIMKGLANESSPPAAANPAPTGPRMPPKSSCAGRGFTTGCFERGGEE